MTCVVLVKSPCGITGIVNDEDGDHSLAEWRSADEAEEATREQPMVKAWGGFIVDLDNLEVREV